MTLPIDAITFLDPLLDLKGCHRLKKTEIPAHRRNYRSMHSFCDTPNAAPVASNGRIPLELLLLQVERDVAIELALFVSEVVIDNVHGKSAIRIGASIVYRQAISRNIEHRIEQEARAV